MMLFKLPSSKLQVPDNTQRSNSKFQLSANFFGNWIFGIVICLALGICFLVIPCYAKTPVTILKVETQIMGSYNEVSVIASENIKPEIILLDSPNRIALAFHNARIKAPITIPGPSSLISMIQAAQFDEDTVYVIVEPSEALTYDYTSLIGKNKFILEFSKAKPGSSKIVEPSAPSEVCPVTTPEAEAPEVIEEAPPTPEVVEQPAPRPAKPEKIAPKAARPEKAALEFKKIKLAKGPLPLKGKTVIVDAGHGGKDPGYIGTTGIFEKGLTLKISLRLKQRLEEAGAKVLMTRNRDVFIRNSEKVRFANCSKADMYVAVHVNAFTKPKIRGCETFYCTPISRKFAQTMQKYLYRTIKTKNKGVQKVKYYVVHYTKMPSVLVETAYLTNPKEEKLLISPDFQDQLAQGMCKGIIEYAKITSWRRSHR